MKRVSSIVVIGLLCVSMFLIYPPKIGAETNSSGFETGFDGWQPFTIGHGTAQRSNSYSHSGSYSVEQIAETSSSDVTSSYGGIRYPITAASDQYELSCWIFVTQRSDGLAGTYIGFYYPTGPFPYLEDVAWNVWSDGSSYLDVRQSEGYTPNLGVSYGLTLNTWHQARIVLYENLGTVSIWLDGMKIVDSYPAFNAGDKPDSYFITASATQGGYVTHQYADDVVISDERPPVGYWKFDEGSGTVAHDSSGNSFDGTIYRATWVDGVVNQALHFDGASNYVAIPDNPSLSGFTQLTLEAWIKPDSLSSSYLTGIINKGNGGGYYGDEYGLQLDNDKVRFILSAGDPTGWIIVVDTDPIISVEQWYHVAAVWDSNNYYIYVNGQLVKSGPTLVTGAVTHHTSNSLNIGGIAAGSWLFNGAIDEAKIYNYARTAEEIQSDYASASGLKRILIVNNPGTFAETWYLPDGTPFTLMSFLRDKGFLVDLWTDISNGRALSLAILSSYDVVILPSWFFDVQDNLQYQNALLDYVNQGGGLLFAGQSGFAQTLDGSLGFKYVGGGFVDASIVDSSHPIMQGISELPKAGGVFVDWDNVIAETPLPSNVAILARTTDPSNRIALIAFQYGNGRVVAGPSDGLLRPYGPTGVDSWSPISQPVTENKLLINAISWVARAQAFARAWKDDSSLGLENDRLYLHGLVATGNYRWFFDYLIFKDTGTTWYQPWGELAMLVYPNFQWNGVSTTDFEVNAFTEADKAYLQYSITSGNLKEELTYTIYPGEPYVNVTLSVTNVGSTIETTNAGVQFTTWIAGDYANDCYFVPGYGQGQFTGSSGNIYFTGATEKWVAEWDQNKGEGCGILSTKGFTPSNIVSEDFGNGEGFKFISDNFALQPGQTSTVYDCYLNFFTGTGWQQTKNFYDSLTLQCQITFDQTGVDHSYPGTVITIDGVNYAASDLPLSFSWDANSVHSFSYASPLGVSSGEQYLWTSTTGLSTAQSDSLYVAGSGSVIGNYVTQYYLTVQTSPSGLSSPSGQGWYDTGSYAPISTTLYVDIVSGSSRYRFNGWTIADLSEISDSSSPSTTVLVDETKTVTANYATQYCVSFAVVPSAAGTTTPSGTSVWEDAGSLPVSATPNSGYSFSQWSSSTPSITFISISSSSTTATIGGPGTITANFVLTPGRYVVTFVESGLPASTRWSVTFNGVTRYSTAMTISYSNIPAGTYQWSVGTPIAGGPGTRYVALQISGSMSVPAQLTQSITFKTQYYLTMNTNAGTTNPSSGWFDSGSKVTISAFVQPTISGERYVWSQWTGASTGSYTGTSNPASNAVIMYGPISEIATWTHQYMLILNTHGVPSPYMTRVSLAGTIVGRASDSSPFTVWLAAGASTGAIRVDSTVSGALDIAYVFASWSDGITNNPRGSIRMTSPVTLTANYQTKYRITFTESGLPSGTSWSVTLKGQPPQKTTEASISFYLFAGTYSFTVGNPAYGRLGSQTRQAFFPVPQSGWITVSVFGTKSQTIKFDALYNFSPDPWAGYEVISNLPNPTSTVTMVKGSWIVQSIDSTWQYSTCAQWIGIGGDEFVSSDYSLVQVGTASWSQYYVQGGNFAIYQVWDSNGNKVVSRQLPATYPVHAGDQMQAEILLQNQAANQWSITINDLSQGWHYSVLVTFHSSMYTAEWIVEHPTIRDSSGNIIPSSLADFHTASFSSCYATVGGNTAQIGSQTYVAQYTMTNSAGQTMAQPSALSQDGTSFTVTWDRGS